jgi:hypothetical protein
MEVDGHDRAVKAGKFVDTVGDKEIKKAGWRTGPTGINEAYGVELPRVGKRLGSSGASEMSEVRRG